MAVVKTKEILPKLEKVVEFVLGRDRARRHKIDIHPDNHPATDGLQIFMDDEQKRFKDAKDAEFDLANTTAHEADHIREFYELYGDRMNGLVESDENVVSVYCEENYGELEKSPALAGEIDNIVKDRRIDAKRGTENPRIQELQRKVNPVYLYLRPSTRFMKPLDACREQFLQKTLLGTTNEPVRKEYAVALDEMVKIANSSGNIQNDPESVKEIYKIFDDNFDIKQPMSRLPDKRGKKGKGKGGGGSSGKKKGGGGSSGRPQQGYSNDENDNIKPRQGRDPNDKRPKNMSDTGEKKPEKPDDKGKEEIDDKDRKKSYSNAGETHGIQVYVAEPSNDSSIDSKIDSLSNDFGIETSNMRRVFTKMQSQERKSVKDVSGDDFDYEEYLEGELEYTLTGIRTIKKCFITDIIDEPRSAWAFLSDISGSTQSDMHNIWKEIQAAMYMIGEGVSTTQNPFALYSFAGDLFVVKDFPEKYNRSVVNKLVSVKAVWPRTGTNLGPSLKVIGDLLKKQNEQQKGIIVVTDGQADNFDQAKESLKYLKESGIHPFIIIIGKQFEEYAKKLTSDLGEDHYTIIERDKLHELHEEMLRLFTKYGLAR